MKSFYLPTLLPVLALGLVCVHQLAEAGAPTPIAIRLERRAAAESTRGPSAEPREGSRTRAPRALAQIVDPLPADQARPACSAPSPQPTALQGSGVLRLDDGTLSQRLDPKSNEELCAWIPFQGFIVAHGIDTRSLPDASLRQLFDRYVTSYQQSLAESARLTELPGGEGAPDPGPEQDTSLLEAAAARYAALQDRLAEEFRPRT